MLETITFDIDPGIKVISCDGRFTMGTQLRQAESAIDSLIQNGARKLVIDLTDTELVDREFGHGTSPHMSFSTYSIATALIETPVSVPDRLAPMTLP